MEELIVFSFLSAEENWGPQRLNDLFPGSRLPARVEPRLQRVLAVRLCSVVRDQARGG